MSKLQDATWKEIPGFPDYEVSEHGQVRRGTRLLTVVIDRVSGRKKFYLSKHSRQYQFYAHRLVALAFIGPKPFKNYEVCHNDGFFHNNHYSNLRWDTRDSNVADKVRHRLQHRAGLGRAKPRDYISSAASDFIAQASKTKAQRRRESNSHRTTYQATLLHP